MIEVENLTKRYGSNTAVDGLTFTVKPGTVTGFLGPNGAGKSTTMRLIAGLDHPTSGTVRVNGRSYHESPAPLAELGILLEAGAESTRWLALTKLGLRDRVQAVVLAYESGIVVPGAQ